MKLKKASYNFWRSEYLAINELDNSAWKKDQQQYKNVPNTEPEMLKGEEIVMKKSKSEVKHKVRIL